MAGIRVALKPGTGEIFAEIAVRMRNPVRPVGQDLVKIMRVGPGSIDAQFNSKALFTERGGVKPWPKTQDFGDCKPARGTLENSGKYRNAWTGGSGSTQSVKQSSVSVGVNPASFPQVLIHQASSPTRVVGKRRDSMGRFLMQLAIFAKCGIWVSRDKVQRGFVIRPRSVGTGQKMLERFRDRVISYLINGK